MPKRKGRDVRREIRLTLEEDRMFRRAADAVGMSVSMFLRHAGRQAAAIEYARRDGRVKRKRRKV